MDEILRNIWLHSLEHCVNIWLVCVVIALISIGSVIKSGLWKAVCDWKMNESLLSAIVVAGVCDVGLILLAVMPGSPLLSVTGELFPSPWLRGLFPALCFETVLVSMIYGLVGGQIRSLQDVLEILTYGISHWPWLIIIALFI